MAPRSQLSTTSSLFLSRLQSVVLVIASGTQPPRLPVSRLPVDALRPLPLVSCPSSRCPRHYFFPRPFLPSDHDRPTRTQLLIMLRTTLAFSLQNSVNLHHSEVWCRLGRHWSAQDALVGWVQVLVMQPCPFPECEGKHFGSGWLDSNVSSDKGFRAVPL